MCHFEEQHSEGRRADLYEQSVMFARVFLLCGRDESDVPRSQGNNRGLTFCRF